MKTSWKAISLLAAMSFVPMLAQAHPGHSGTHSFANGFSHPLFGLDHILAMVAVGLWAAQQGGRSIWAVPASFVGLMSIGGMLGMMGVRLPMVEAGILASIVVLGLLIATAARLPLVASMILVGLFAIFHGHAHGTEIPATANGFSYALGFVLATAALHACGIGLGLLARNQYRAPALRYTGAAIALAGVCLWLA